MKKVAITKCVILLIIFSSIFLFMGCFTAAGDIIGNQIDKINYKQYDRNELQFPTFDTCSYVNINLEDSTISGKFLRLEKVRNKEYETLLDKDTIFLPKLNDLITIREYDQKQQAEKAFNAEFLGFDFYGIGVKVLTHNLIIGWNDIVSIKFDNSKDSLAADSLEWLAGSGKIPYCSKVVVASKGDTIKIPGEEIELMETVKSNTWLIVGIGVGIVGDVICFLNFMKANFHFGLRGGLNFPHKSL